MNVPEKLPPGISLPLHTNLSPQPIFKEEANEYWRRVSMYGFGRAQTFHQVKDLPGHEGKFSAIHVQWYSDCAYAIHVKLKYESTDEGYVAVFTPEFFRIGCEHKKVTYRNLGRCYNEYTCKDCGYVWTVDSSD